MTATVYYQRHGVCITEHRVCIGGRHYDVGRLGGVMKVSRPRHPAVTVSAAIGAAEAVLAVPVAALLRAPAVFLYGVVALLVAGSAALVCARRWPRESELVARYEQRQVMLFATADAQEFGQVARALQRAIEAHER